jgi:hypothetical protein
MYILASHAQLHFCLRTTHPITRSGRNDTYQRIRRFARYVSETAHLATDFARHGRCKSVLVAVRLYAVAGRSAGPALAGVAAA